MPACPVCPLSYCTAFDIPWSSFLFYRFVAPSVFFYFCFRYLSFFRDGIIKKGRMDLGISGGWGGNGYVFLLKKKSPFLPSKNLRYCHSLS